MRIDRDTILSGVCGLALGDAVGVPFEFQERKTVKKYDLSRMWEYGSHKQPIGTWSDDTSMVLATLDGMCSNVNSMSTIMDNFRAWMESGKYTANGDVFDIGGTTARALNRYRMGEPLALCGEDDEYSNGNGSLMRMLPVSFYIYTHRGLAINEDTVNMIGMFSSLTHAHDISKECCVYYVYIALYCMLADKSKAGLQRAIEGGIEAVENYYKNTTGSTVLGVRGLESLKEILSLKEEDIYSSGYAIDSLEASLWSLYNSTGFKSAVCNAVALGGDTDTIGAITGSLAGLFYGWDNLPTDWMAELKNKPLIYDVCNRYYELHK